jgi:hypothetical protein
MLQSTPLNTNVTLPKFTLIVATDTVSILEPMADIEMGNVCALPAKSLMMYSLPNGGLAGNITEKGEVDVLFTPMYKSVSRALNGLVDVITTGTLNVGVVLMLTILIDSSSSSHTGTTGEKGTTGLNVWRCCTGNTGNEGNGITGSNGRID